MQFFRDSSTIPGRFPGTVMTIGNFDGVHLGHQMIIRDVVARARRIDGTAVLMTFDPPPGRVLGKTIMPQLTSVADKGRLVATLGVDVFVCETFTRELASMTPEEFAREVLDARFEPRAILVGYDFCFGKDRKGDAGFLKAWFGPRGCDVVQFSALKQAGGAGEIVSSSQIRRLVQGGQVVAAAAMLGRPYFVHGSVVHGDARGRTIGFPTANLESDNELMPAHGVYATLLEVDGRTLPGVTNIGRRPTFHGEAVTTETHLLEYDGNLYGESVVLHFIERIRGEEKFEGIDALKAQIARDVATARHILASRELPESP